MNDLAGITRTWIPQDMIQDLYKIIGGVGIWSIVVLSQPEAKAVFR